MTGQEAHAQRVKQIKELLPGLLSGATGQTCLYIGATPKRFQLGKELHDAGYDMTLLEVDKNNAYYYQDHPWLGGGVICGNVRDIVLDRQWDVIVWWHGPEHIAIEDLEPTVRALEAVAKRLVVLAAPWGVNVQPMVENNPWQEHKSHLQPEVFGKLGYQTATLGKQGDVSTWPHILAWKVLETEPQKPDRVVYTAIFGDYDHLKANHYPGRFVCFSDREMGTVGWEHVRVERRFEDPRREARMYKALAHKWFPDAQESLWLDGNAELLVPPDELFAFLDGADVVMCKHPTSATLADEAALIVRLGKADREQIARQMECYRGYHDAPVGATGWLLRRHTGATQALNVMWWAELTAHTVRDQLSLPYCLARLGTPALLVNVPLYDNKLVKIHRHGGKK